MLPPTISIAPTTSPLRGTPPRAGGEFLRHRVFVTAAQPNSPPARGGVPKGRGGGSKKYTHFRTVSMTFHLPASLQKKRICISHLSFFRQNNLLIKLISDERCSFYPVLSITHIYHLSPAITLARTRTEQPTNVTACRDAYLRLPRYTYI